MREYSKVRPYFWIGSTGRGLRGDAEAQVLALYLMTSPHSNMLGAFYCPMAFITLETGLSEEGASKALRSLERANFCLFDPKSEYIWVIEMARNQIGDKLSKNDNRVKGVAKDYAALPNLPFLKGFFDHYKDIFYLEKCRHGTTDNTSPFEAPSKPGAGAGAGAGKEKTLGASRGDAPGGTPPSGDDVPFQAEFEEVWKLYPKRRGSNPKKSALKAYQARRRSGVKALDLKAGVMRYRDHLTLEGRVHTSYVKQASTFFGPDEHWAEVYDTTPAPNGGGPVPPSEINPNDQWVQTAKERGKEFLNEEEGET